MERRHYLIIAHIIRIMLIPKDEREKVAKHFAMHLKHSNPNFKQDVFLKACQEDPHE